MSDYLHEGIDLDNTTKVWECENCGKYFEDDDSSQSDICPYCGSGSTTHAHMDNQEWLNLKSKLKYHVYHGEVSIPELTIEENMYRQTVRFVIGCMIDLWLDKEKNGRYSFIADLHHYTQTIIKEGILPLDEFEKIIIQNLEEKNIYKGKLT